jgi:hypothetical protein
MFNSELKVNCLFADNTINNWSAKTAESIFRYLLYNETQENQARYFKVTQPAISKRLFKQKELVSPHQLPKLIQKLKLKIKTNNAKRLFFSS